MYTPRWQTKSSLPGDRQRAVAQPTVVRSRHIRKSRAEPVVVHADQRIAIQQIDVVVDDHDVAGGISSDSVHPQHWRRSSSSTPSAFITRTGNVARWAE